ncbi:hypothetical protein DL767_009436 [Monosporascus sp. MG133]|nr:hypothetical protein DL767_009436 [Monosporascus sp. MG133]
MTKQGGPLDIYTTPSAGTPATLVDCGLFSFIDCGDASAFLARLNISTALPPQFPSATRHVDFTAGEELTSYVSPEWADVAAALEVYLEQCEEYEHMLVPGLWGFPEGAGIPEDLLMNFGEFATKYGIEAFSPPSSYLRASAAASSRHRRRNRDIYDAIATLLGDDDVPYSTTAVSSERDEDGVTVMVHNREDGSLATIHAARLLIAIPPLADLLEPFDLDAQEEAVFPQWEYTREYAVLFALLGGQDELAHSRIISDEALIGCGARLLLRAQFDVLVAGSDAASPAGTKEEIEVVAFAEHGLMHLRVSAENHRRGSFRDLQTEGFSVERCTEVTPKCPAEATAYGYHPVLGVNSALCAVFGVLCILQLTFCLLTRVRAYSMVIACGCLLGWLIMHNNPWNPAGMRLQIVCLIIAPTFIAAGIYLTLNCDIGSIVLQAIGGGVAAAAAEESMNLLETGNGIAISGIAFQVTTMLICGVLAAEYIIEVLRYRRHAKGVVQAQEKHSASKAHVF